MMSVLAGVRRGWLGLRSMIMDYGTRRRCGRYTRRGADQGGTGIGSRQEKHQNPDQ
jgi:hypothetical protein